MGLALVATFGSLPEAQVAFSVLEGAGLHPIPGFNMNTPGIAGGMAPSAYPLNVPAEEVAEARRLLAELRQSAPAIPDDEVEDDEDVAQAPGVLTAIRPLVAYLVAAALAAWLLFTIILRLKH